MTSPAATTRSGPVTRGQALDAAAPLDDPPAVRPRWWRRLGAHDPRSARWRDIALAVLVVVWMLSDLALAVALDEDLLFLPASDTSLEVQVVDEGGQVLREQDLAQLDDEIIALEGELAGLESQLRDESLPAGEADALAAEIESLRSQLDDLYEVEAAVALGRAPSEFGLVDWVLVAVLYPLVGLLLLARRRRPSVVFWLVSIVVIAVPAPVTSLGAVLPSAVAPLAALYTVASEGTRTSRVVTGSLLAAGLVGASALFVVFDSLTAVSTLVSSAAPHVVVWALGALSRAQREQAVTMTEQAERLRAERADSIRRATLAERSRIARELHDVVAHHLSLIVVQAEGARATAVAAGQRPPAAVESVASTGRVAMTELHRLLGVLRADDLPTGREGVRVPDAVVGTGVRSTRESVAPQPTLDQLEELVAQSRRAGLAVDLVVEGEPRPVAPGIAVSAYRVVQEALTNVRKHAGPAHAVVTLTWTETDLGLHVVDDGIGTALAGDGAAGHGLTGIRERATLLGGTADTGPGPDGGFVVDVRLPLSAPEGET